MLLKVTRGAQGKDTQLCLSRATILKKPAKTSLINKIKLTTYFIQLLAQQLTPRPYAVR